MHAVLIVVPGVIENWQMKLYYNYQISKFKLWRSILHKRKPKIGIDHASNPVYFYFGIAHNQQN